MPLPSLLPAGKRSRSGQEKEASEHADNHAERQPSFRKPEVQNPHLFPRLARRILVPSHAVVPHIYRGSTRSTSSTERSAMLPMNKH
ncbi:hypothetical protein B6J62_19015 [Klebsiella quasipneumoniae]|nr:hypothetical protein B6J62_19015 [Klebsiella quasipneumoniae]